MSKLWIVAMMLAIPAAITQVVLAQAQRFTRIGVSQPVVIDNVTGLIWQGCAIGQSGNDCSGGSAGTFTWQGALAQCQSLEWDGQTDWYLPNIKELRSIVDNRNTSPAIDVHAFPGTPSFWFWSSSSGAVNAGYAWLVHFSDGNVGHLDKTSTYNVRCARVGP